MRYNWPYVWAVLLAAEDMYDESAFDFVSAYNMGGEL